MRDLCAHRARARDSFLGNSALIPAHHSWHTTPTVYKERENLRTVSLFMDQCPTLSSTRRAFLALKSLLTLGAHLRPSTMDTQLAVETHLTWFHERVWRPFVSETGIVSSRTVKSQQTSTLIALLEYFDGTSASLSLGASAMRMEALITMLSWTTDAYGISAGAVAGMREECTQISNRYHVLLGDHTNTLERIETFYTTHSENRDLLLLELMDKRALRLKENGLRSQLHQTKTHFLRRSSAWIHAVWYALTTTSWRTHPGDIPIYEDDTSRLRESPYPSPLATSRESLLDNLGNLVGRFILHPPLRSGAPVRERVPGPPPGAKWIL